MKSNKKIARIAGLLYLLLIIGGIFAEFFVRQKTIVWGNAAETAQNIMNSEWLFRLGFVGDLFMALTFFFLPLVLYSLLKQVNNFMARLMVLSVVISVSIICLNMLNQIAALILLNHPEYTGVFETAQLHGLVMFLSICMGMVTLLRKYLPDCGYFHWVIWFLSLGSFQGYSVFY